jgi:hypothetical protein
MGRPVKGLPDLEELSSHYFIGLGLDCLHRRKGGTKVLSRTSISINKRQYSHIRCLYYLHHGYQPDEIEFRDGDKTNWHIDNLRNKPIKAKIDTQTKFDFSKITIEPLTDFGFKPNNLPTTDLTISSIKPTRYYSKLILPDKSIVNEPITTNLGASKNE